MTRLPCMKIMEQHDPTFTTVVISTDADGAHDVSIADVDGVI